MKWWYASKSLTRTLQICRFFSPSFGGRMASAFSLVKSRSLYLVIGPMWQKFILLTIPHYSKIDWPMTLFCPRSPPFMSSNGIFLQAKWSKIKERVEGWKSGKKMWFKRITVWRGVIGQCPIIHCCLFPYFFTSIFLNLFRFLIPYQCNIFQDLNSFFQQLVYHQSKSPIAYINLR